MGKQKGKRERKRKKNITDDSTVVFWWLEMLRCGGSKQKGYFLLLSLTPNSWGHTAAYQT